MSNTPSGVKPQLLEKWIGEHKTLPAQGTAEWLNGRKFRIGGSEVSVIEGVNPYSKKKDIIAQHLGLTHFQGNAATRWGKVLEDITIAALEKLFNCSIYVPGSIPHSEVTVHANSPDGVTYVKAWDSIVLIEIKNPSGRIPGGTIPKYYKSQIKSGLDTIPICDFAIFADHMQRKCALNELRPGNRTYDINFHNATRDRVRNDPIMITMLGIYCTSHEYSKRHAVVDYGAADRYEFSNMLETVDEHRVWSIHYGQIYICDNTNKIPPPSSWYDEFDEYCKKNNYMRVGILPLKTFRFSLIPLRRELDYIDGLKDDMYEVVEIIKDLDGLDPVIQRAKLNKMFDDPEIRKVNSSAIARKMSRCGHKRLIESHDNKPSSTQVSTDV
jgi:putative phage-type endonuclease